MNPSISDESKFYYKKMIVLGVPIMFQNLISIGLNLLDTLMIGALGEQQLAAVGAANQVYFIFSITLFGLFSGSAVYTSQYFGADDYKGIRKVLGMDYAVAFLSSIFVAFVSFMWAKEIIGVFASNRAVINYGSEYIRIACFSYTFAAISMAISYNSRAIQKVFIPVCINGIALILNGVLNYILIFGLDKIPAYGVRGAAYATLIARIFELFALVTYIYGSKEHIFKAKLRDLFGFSWKHFYLIMKTAIPTILTDSSWAFSMALVFAVYGMLGTAELAVSQVANVICEILQAAYFGVGNATAMIIGESLGKGQKDRAYHYGKLAIGVVIFLNVVATIFIVMTSGYIAGFYNFSQSTSDLLILTIKTVGIIISVKTLGYIYIVGILRAGGDAIFIMKLELVCNVLIQLPIAYFGVTVLNLSLPFVMVLVETGDLIRIILCAPRFVSKKWIKIVIGNGQ